MVWVPESMTEKDIIAQRVCVCVCEERERERERERELEITCWFYRC